MCTQRADRNWGHLFRAEESSPQDTVMVETAEVWLQSNILLHRIHQGVKRIFNTLVVLDLDVRIGV